MSAFTLGSTGTGCYPPAKSNVTRLSHCRGTKRAKSMARILVIEDEEDLQRVLDYNLRQAGHDVVGVKRGDEGLRIARESKPDLVLLDLMLPDISGTEICKALKDTGSTRGIPVIMLTARGEEIDRVVGFELGADDYVVKPFSVREVVLRVRGILRRVEHGGALIVDEDAHRARVGSRTVGLTPLEVSVLVALRDGVVWSREELIVRAWRDRRADLEVVDSAVKRLRPKLEPLGLTIVAVRNAGYRLDPLGISSSS